MLVGRKTRLLSTLLTGRAMNVYTRMSDTDTNDPDKLKKALLTIQNYTEDGFRKRFREVKPETEEMPDQFVVFKELHSQVVRTFRKQFWRIRSPSGSDSQGTDNQNVRQNVRQKSVPARIRRVRRLLARVTRRRSVQWWLDPIKMVKRLVRV